MSAQCIHSKTEVKNLRRKIKRLTTKSNTFKTRLVRQNAEQLNDDIAFRRVTRNVTSTEKIFTKMQFTETKKQPKVVDLHWNKKIMSLSLFKRGAKVPNLHQKRHFGVFWQKLKLDQG